MKMQNILLVAIVLFAIAYFYGTKEELPIKFFVCNKGFVDCQLIARFDDMTSCQTTNQKWGWYCDQTDKSNITCQEKESSFADSYCSQ